MGEVLKGSSLWDALEGKKEEVSETVDIEFGGVKGEITVIFKDADEIQKVEKEYKDKLPPKPLVEFKGIGKIELPNDKYPQFNDHKKAQEWEENNKPLIKEKNFRTAYEFIADDEKPHEDPEKGTKILQERLRYMDAINIVNKGMEISGVSSQLDEATKNS